MSGLEIRPVVGIGDVTAGDDLVGLIAGAASWLADGDVLVVTSKIVSKAEGNLVEVPADGPERDAARAATLVAETARVVARRGPTTIVQTHHGFVMAAAGIDASNVDKTHLVLLPADPDASARRLRAGFQARGLDVAVIISDTMGRTWRNGLTDVALGAAGIAPFRDHRGETDPYGNELQITQMAVIDELSAAGELVKGKVDNVPVAVVRGYLSSVSARDDGPGAAVLLRDAESDMFSLGTAEARAAGLRDAAQLADGLQLDLPGLPVDPEAVRRALETVADHLSRFTTITPDEVLASNGATAALHLQTRDTTPGGLMRLGADAHRLRAALAAESVASIALPHDDGIRLDLSGVPA
ncbi:coenzyme F420-0:L-glutamate ligase [Actinoplanes sp. NPDC026619]|uniref:coenzyme F420-0:L-glutamate ligase n=1 Tax=Actinoplanes sp. NPDC026619 TaxID=3155798 RepID=UPI003405155A